MRAKEPLLLQQLGESIWVFEEKIRFLGIPTRHRMTVVRLGAGGVLLHSPTRVNAPLIEEIEHLGPIVAIIAPSWWHDLYLAQWMQAIPAAGMYGAPGLAAARRRLRFTAILENAAPALWSADLEQHHVEGIGLWLDEIAFYHGASRTPILTDLLFNYDERDAPLTRRVGRLFGGQSGFQFPALYRAFVDDRRFGVSIQRLAAWDFTRIVLGHGGIIESDARAKFLAALHWLSGAGTTSE